MSPWVGEHEHGLLIVPGHELLDFWFLAEE
jgi:hypothetical protein